jgi:hypothetical protein
MTAIYYDTGYSTVARHALSAEAEYSFQMPLTRSRFQGTQHPRRQLTVALRPGVQPPPGTWPSAKESRAARRQHRLACYSRAASHPAFQFGTGNAVPVAELLDLFEVNLLGENSRRLLCCLGVTQVIQHVNYLLPAYGHAFESNRAKRSGSGRAGPRVPG